MASFYKSAQELLLEQENQRLRAEVNYLRDFHEKSSLSFQGNIYQNPPIINVENDVSNPVMVAKVSQKNFDYHFITRSFTGSELGLAYHASKAALASMDEKRVMEYLSSILQSHFYQLYKAAK